MLLLSSKTVPPVEGAEQPWCNFDSSPLVTEPTHCFCCWPKFCVCLLCVRFTAKFTVNQWGVLFPRNLSIWSRLDPLLSSSAQQLVILTWFPVSISTQKASHDNMTVNMLGTNTCERGMKWVPECLCCRLLLEPSCSFPLVRSAIACSTIPTNNRSRERRHGLFVGEQNFGQSTNWSIIWGVFKILPTSWILCEGGVNIEGACHLSLTCTKK